MDGFHLSEFSKITLYRLGEITESITFNTSPGTMSVLRVLNNNMTIFFLSVKETVSFSF